MSINGVIPVMLTPFKEGGEIDFDGLEALIEWYLGHGVDGLFAVCQSSEMHLLTLSERTALGRFVVEQTAGRKPVIVSGHVADSIDEQAAELAAMAEVGADAVVLVTNRLDPKNSGEKAFESGLAALLDRLPRETQFGLYECPAPYRRLLSDDELARCRDTGRFHVLKDVSCDLETVARRARLCAGSPLAICNACGPIAQAAMRSGSPGFAGIANNFHPDLYKWLLVRGPDHPELAKELAIFLANATMIEPYGYPAAAKLFHARLGTFSCYASRSNPGDVRERVWALDAMLDAIGAGEAAFRAKLKAAA
jgi:4-hydroxy-tetrahydrodipicolinate synthase